MDKINASQYFDSWARRADIPVEHALSYHNLWGFADTHQEFVLKTGRRVFDEVGARLS